MKKLASFLCLAIALIGAGPSPTDRQYSTEKNLLINPGFENNLAGWTNSSGTFAHTTTAANVGSGRGAASFDASASTQYMESGAYTIPQRMIGKVCDAHIWYKGGDSNLTVSVIDGSATTLASQALVASTNYTQSPVLLFPCGESNSSTLKIRITAGADAAIVYVDDVFLGTSGAVPSPAAGVFKAYTPVVFGATNGATFTNVTAVGQWRRSLDVVEGHVELSFGGAPGTGTGSIAISLPPGLTPNPSVVDFTYLNPYGYGVFRDAGTQSYPIVATFDSAAPVSSGGLSGFIMGVSNAASGSPVSATVPATIASGDTLTIEFAIPVTEWSGTPSYVTSASQAVENAVLNRTTSQTGINPNGATRAQISYTQAAEKVGGGTLDTGSYIVGATGYYQVSATVSIAGTNVQNGLMYLLAMSGSSFASPTVVRVLDSAPTVTSTLFTLSGSVVMKLTAGERVYIGVESPQNYSSSTLTSSSASTTAMSITRLTDEYGRPVVGFGYGTSEIYGLTKGGRLPANSGTAAISAGWAGESKSQQVSAATTTTGDTYTAVSGSITLEPGSWEVGYNASLQLSDVTAGQTVSGNVVVYNGSSNLNESLSFATKAGIASVTNSITVPMSGRAIVNITSSTTYSLRIRCSLSNTSGTCGILGTNVTGSLTDPDTYSVIWARRL